MKYFDSTKDYTSKEILDLQKELVSKLLEEAKKTKDYISYINKVKEITNEVNLLIKPIMRRELNI